MKKLNRYPQSPSNATNRASLLGDLEAIRSLLDEPMPSITQPKNGNKNQLDIPILQPEQPQDLPVLNNVVEPELASVVNLAPTVEPTQHTLFRKHNTDNNHNVTEKNNIKKKPSALELPVQEIPVQELPVQKPPVQLSMATSTQSTPSASSDSIEEKVADGLMTAQANAVRKLEASLNQQLSDKGRLKAEERQNLKAKANILVQDIVDEFVPMIEAALRKRIQGDMDKFLNTMISDHK